MKLQIAIDLATTEKAVEMVSLIHDVIDIVEVGTPLIMREGMHPVRTLKAMFPGVTILADTKIVDGGDIEAGDAFDAGADIVTVLAVADDATLDAVVGAARKVGREVMADMICVPRQARRAADLDKMGIDYVCVHTGVDVQARGVSPLHDLDEVKGVLQKSKVAVAGGISMKTIQAVKIIGPDVVVAGGSLTRAADLRAAVIEMKNAIRN